jgi:hypothetical protein
MGAEFGPLSASQIKQIANVGHIRPDTLVRKGTDGKWVNAERVKGHFDKPVNDSLERQPFSASDNTRIQPLQSPATPRSAKTTSHAAPTKPLETPATTVTIPNRNWYHD